MGKSFRQSEEWESLITLLKQGESDSNFQPILWVGAGLSVGAGYPTTLQLVEKLRDYSVKKLVNFDPLDHTFAVDSPEKSFTHWVQHFAIKNSYGRLNKALSGIFNNLPCKPTATHFELVKLPFKALFTTNYDELLEAALNTNGQKFNLLTHEQNLNVMQDQLISLYKIHGGLNNIREWTLDESSYQNFADRYPFLNGQLKNVLFPHSVVYIGCSMLDPRVIDWYRYCEAQNQLDQLEYSIVIIRKAAWQQLPGELKELYDRANVHPLLFDDYHELYSLVAELGSKVMDEHHSLVQNNNAKVVVDSTERKRREVQQLDDILYEKLAPRIVQAIACVWLEAEKGVDYLEQLKLIQGQKARIRGKLAFEALVEDFAELWQKLVGKRTDFGIQKAVILALDSLLGVCDLTHESLSEVDFEPHALYGNLGINHTPQVIKNANEDTRKLFKKVLKETCELIVDCFEALPTWSVKNLNAQLEQAPVLFKKLREVLDRWHDSQEENTDEKTQLEEEYRRAVARRFDQLQIFGISFGKHARKYQLSVAYISLTTETAFNSNAASEVLSTAEALTRFDRLVILGEAGQGKTTLLQWLTVQCGRKAFIGNKAKWNKKIPVLIKLREVLNYKSLPLGTEFYSIMVENIVVKPLHQNWLRDILNDHKAILMIDGFDEVPAARRQEVLKWIDTLCENYTGNQFILTSRPAAYDATALAEQDFQIIQLQTMDHHAQQDFLEHWHQAIALEYDETQPAALSHQSQNLLQKLNQQRTLRSLAENPLLCGVICLLHHERSGYLPKDRTELYEASCRMLLDSRDREKKVPEADEFKVLNYRDKQSLLTDTAQWMSKNEKTSLSPEQLVERFELKLNELPDLNRKVTAEQLKSFFLERSGLLLQVGVTEVQFAHRSFQEFFTAKYMEQERRWEILSQNVMNNYWHETIQLVVGLCQSRQENETFLTGLLEQANQFENKENGQSAVLLYLLVLRCREVMSEVSPKFNDQFERVLPKVIPPSSPSMVDALVAAGELALPYLKRPDVQSEQADFYCVQTLVKIETAEAYQLLKDYFKQDKSSYIDKLCGVIKNLNLDIVRVANLTQLILDDGLEKFPSKLIRRTAFLCQEPRLMATCTTKKLTKNDFDEWELRQGFAPLAGYTKLQVLDLTGSQINDLTPISRLMLLKELYLSNTQIADIEQLKRLSQLQVLFLGMAQINDYSPLAELSNLQTLDLSKSQIHDLSPLAGLSQLRSLSVDKTQINDLTALVGLTKLQTLDLYDTLITDLTPLMGLSQLKELDINYTQIKDLTPLAGLRKLRRLNLRSTLIVDLTPLEGLTKLETIYLEGTIIDDVTSIQKKLPNCKIII